MLFTLTSSLSGGINLYRSELPLVAEQQVHYWTNKTNKTY